MSNISLYFRVQQFYDIVFIFGAYLNQASRNSTQTIKKEKSSDVDSMITETFNQYDIPLKVSDNIRGENFGRWKIYITA